MEEEKKQQTEEAASADEQQTGQAEPFAEPKAMDGEAPQSGEADEAQSEPALAEELTATREQLMRLAAEFENYKKRMEREQAKRARYEGENILRELLSTVDNLERALAQGNDPDAAGDAAGRLEAIIAGVDLTRKGLLASLERFGVKAIESLGQPFNPEEQDALTMETDNDIPANHVLREFAKGYRFKDRILRHAQVVVSSGPQA